MVYGILVAKHAHLKDMCHDVISAHNTSTIPGSIVNTIKMSCVINERERENNFHNSTPI